MTPFSKAALLSVLLLAPLRPSEARDWVVAQGRPGAADANPGTEEQPLLTINAAAQQAQPGDTVLVHAGVYRERVAPARGGTEAQPIVYQAAPGEAVAVKGSDAWTHWQPVDGQPGVYAAEIDGHVAVSDGNPNPFLIAVRIDAADPDVAARPASVPLLPKTLGQVFYDGRPMAELSSEGEIPLQENGWIATADGKRVLAHFPGNPPSLAAHLVEVSVRSRIFAPHLRALAYVQVRGFLFEHCANQGPFPQGGEVSPRSGSHWLFEGNTIRYAKTIGLDVGSETFALATLRDIAPEQRVRMNNGHDVVQGNLVTDNGLCGIAGWNHGGVVIRNNVVERNNALGFSGANAKWEEWAGIKLHEGAAVIEGNLVRDNDAYGIWLDNNWTGSRIHGNVVLNNRQGGIFLELGDGRAVIDNNIVAFTRPGNDFYAGAGIYSHDSSGLVIAHNLIVGNADCGVLLRTISGRVFQGQPVHVSHTRVLNNIIVNNSRSAIALPYPGEMAEDNVSDYNVLNGSRDVWLGFDASPALFGLNISKEKITVDQLYAAYQEALAKGPAPAEEPASFKTWKRYPTLTLSAWRLLMGQDLHSVEVPAPMMTAILRPGIPEISYKADAGIVRMACPPVDGVDKDFFGDPIQGPAVHPGPFQNLSTNLTERVLFPVR